MNDNTKLIEAIEQAQKAIDAALKQLEPKAEPKNETEARWIGMIEAGVNRVLDRREKKMSEAIQRHINANPGLVSALSATANPKTPAELRAERMRDDQKNVSCVSAIWSGNRA